MGSNNDQPPKGLLMSIAIRLDHGLGVPRYYDQMHPPGTHVKMLHQALEDARRAWEEVMGKGYWNEKNNAEYESLLNESFATVAERGSIIRYQATAASPSDSAAAPTDD